MKPVAPKQRATELDVIRAVALYGVLLVNFSSPSLGGFQVFGSWDWAASWGIENFAYGKVYPLFALLFGLGFTIQQSRASSDFVTFHFKRMTALLALGLAHTILVWEGDILHTYAIGGLALPLFKNLRSRVLLLIAFVFLTVSASRTPIVHFVFGSTAASGASIEAWRSSADYAPVVVDRVSRVAHGLSDPGLWIRNLDVFGMFLIGLVVGRSGVVWNPRNFRRPLWNALAVSFCVAAAARLGPVIGRVFGGPAILIKTAAVADLYMGPAMGIFYGSALALALQYPTILRIASPLAFVGRASLTNYLTQSLVGSLLFYSYAGNLYGKLGYASGVALATALFGLQILFSVAWLEWAQFGPFEWLWRSASYSRWERLRRSPLPGPISTKAASGPLSQTPQMKRGF